MSKTKHEEVKVEKGSAPKREEVKSHAEQELGAIRKQTEITRIHEEAKEMDGAEFRENGNVRSDADKQADEKGAVAIKYRNHLGETVAREYSKEVHGDSYRDLAEEFKKANAQRLITE